MGRPQLIRRAVAASLALFAALSAGVAFAQPARKAPDPKPNERRAQERLIYRDVPRSLGDVVFEKPLLEASDAPAEGDRAAPPNDNCSSPTVIVGPGSFPFDNTDATTDGQPHFLCNFFGQMQISRDVWFRWQAPLTASYVVDTCVNTTIDTKIAVYNDSGECPPTDDDLLRCNDDACSNQSRVTFSAVANQWYRIRVGVFPTQAGGPGTLRIQFQPGQNLCGQPSANCQAPDNSNAYEATGAFVYDDFRPASSGAITSVCFSGAYFDGVGNCAGSGEDQFTVSYYHDFFGSPDFSPFAEYNWTQTTLTGPIPTGELINNAIPVYSYILEHPPVNVTAGECYWIVIHNTYTGEECAWYWQKGQPGNMVAFQTEFFPSPADVIPADMAFCFNLPLQTSSLCQSATPPANDNCANAAFISCFGGATFSNIFATDDPSDPPFSCRLEGPAQGSGSVWFRFTSSATSAAISLCQSLEGDSMVAVYSGTCGNLTELACNDDFCGRRSLVTVTGLTIGQTYFIQCASWSYSDRGQYTLTLNCPIPDPPPNDTCAGAQLINLSPDGTGFASEFTYFATPDPEAPACSFNPIIGPGIWYRVVGNGRPIVAETCAAQFDTKLNVYCGSCDGLVCVGQSDDACGDGARVEWRSEPGQDYYILVHGFSGAVGHVLLDIISDPEPCSPPVACESCVVTCPPGAIQEIEACGETTNEGCLESPVAVQKIACGDTICGTASAVNGVRDTDWYEFDLAVESVVTWEVTAELPVEFFILTGSCPATILAADSIERCGTGSASARLFPGTYRLFVANVDDAYPCGTFNSYIATLTCQPIGACCVGAECVQTTATDCATRGGDFGGPASICDISYTPITCSSAFEDIAPTGDLVEFAGDDGALADIGFTFAIFGREYTQVGVSSDGYLGFEASLTQPVNAPIPSPGAPNNIIAPLWDDFVPSSGAVYTQTLGVAPNRRFIVQWDSLSQFLMTDSNTFQVVLYEGSNCVEFRYGQITPEAFPGDYTIGIEDLSGTRGAGVSAAGIAFGSCLRFCPVATPAGCEVTGCSGDADGDGSVDFDDITSVLSNWGGAGPGGDANRDGQVNFDDITAVLANWGCEPMLACPGDADGDGNINFDDITTILANWNASGALGDANGDGQVNFDDITSVLASWQAACRFRMSTNAETLVVAQLSHRFLLHP